MEAELAALDAALKNPQKPLTALVGGAKISSKLAVLENLVEKVDCLVIGGAMAHTFLKAQGREIGKSLYEPELESAAENIMRVAERRACEILLPMDGVCARTLEKGARTETFSFDDMPPDMMILDAGPKSVQAIIERVNRSRTVVWNGPLGAFETKPFDEGTNKAAQAVAEATAQGKVRSIGGGGDTMAALAQAGCADSFTFISTGGGAFLEWLEGKDMPGLDAMRR